MQLRSKWVLALALGVLQPSVVHADAPRAAWSSSRRRVGSPLECETQACRSLAAAACRR
ncbi:MAG: hypothetical protein IPL19_16045 [Sandaracinaceae bacterium]|nr:hypothetical protein [Sandaracinaceae bacterium]